MIGLSASFAAVLAGAAVAADWSPRLSKVSGEALVYAKGEEEGVLAETGAPIEDGDRIETGDDGRVELAMEPESLVELGPKTSFTLSAPKISHGW